MQTDFSTCALVSFSIKEPVIQPPALEENLAAVHELCRTGKDPAVCAYMCVCQSVFSWVISLHSSFQLISFHVPCHFTISFYFTSFHFMFVKIHKVKYEQVRRFLLLNKHYFNVFVETYLYTWQVVLQIQCSI